MEFSCKSNGFKGYKERKGDKLSYYLKMEENGGSCIRDIFQCYPALKVHKELLYLPIFVKSKNEQ